MTRIDANLATQVADTARPAQTTRDSEAQAGEARRLVAASQDPTANPATPEQVKAAAERLQTVIESATGRQLDFSLNDRFKELIVKISDRKTGEVIREFPSKEFMKLRERLDDLIGMFIDEKA